MWRISNNSNPWILYLFLIIFHIFLIDDSLIDETDKFCSQNGIRDSCYVLKDQECPSSMSTDKALFWVTSTSEFPLHSSWNGSEFSSIYLPRWSLPAVVRVTLDHPSLHSFRSHHWQRLFDPLRHFRSTVEFPPRVPFVRDWAHPLQRWAVGCHEIYPFESRLLLHQNRSEWDCPRNCNAREHVRCWRRKRIVFPIGSICVTNPHGHQRTWWL